MQNSPMTTIFLSLILCDLSFADLGRAMDGEGMPDVGPRPAPLDSARPPGRIYSRKGWTVTCDSAHSGNDCGKAIDGDTGTFWHSEYDPQEARFPHWIIIDMQQERQVSGIAMIPRQDNSENGIVTRHEIYCSLDKDFKNLPVAYGTWALDKTEKFSTFETKKCRYLKLSHLAEPNNDRYTGISELKVYEGLFFTAPDPKLGVWAETLNTPIVPAACAALPSGKMVIWSSWKDDKFTDGPGGETLVAIYNPDDKTISQRMVTNTNHDMFCPGITMDEKGRIFVTGGNNAQRLSIYNPDTDTWTQGPDMNIQRGYPASCLTSNGNIFVIGGSWSGGQGNKNGELWNPTTQKWTLLPGCKVDPMTTADKEGAYRGDNHGWIFGWKDNFVFQAGPSKAMNWYSTTGDGDTIAAGNRADDDDAMCGVAAMYDAGKGEILTCGGSRNYVDTASSNNAYTIKIGDPKTKPEVKPTENKMVGPRIFHNAVILPNGKVMIAGGQNKGKPFNDEGYQNRSELYDPKTRRFQVVAAQSIPRNYHSVALLMKDGSVMLGGGGLCGTCTTNHFDFQVYKPYYFFNADGSDAVRPKVVKLSNTVVKHGDKINIRTSEDCEDLSLMRLGSATHTVNTDQRRVPLDMTQNGDKTYSFTIPNDPGICPCGFYWVFVHNTVGTPSIGEVMQVTGCK